MSVHLRHVDFLNHYQKMIARQNLTLCMQQQIMDVYSGDCVTEMEWQGLGWIYWCLFNFHMRVHTYCGTSGFANRSEF